VRQSLSHKCDAVFTGADPFLNPVPVHGQILRNRSLAHKHAVKPMIRPSPAAWAKASATSSAPCRSTASSTKSSSKNRSTTGFKFFGIPNPPLAPMAHSSPAIRSEKPKRLEAKKGFRCSNRWWMTCWISRRRPECRSRQNRDCPSAAQPQPTKKRNFTAETRSSQSSESILIQFFFTQRPPRLCGESSKSFKTPCRLTRSPVQRYCCEQKKSWLKFPIHWRRCVKQRRQRVRVSCRAGNAHGRAVSAILAACDAARRVARGGLPTRAPAPAR